MYFVLLLYCWAAKAIHRSSTPSSTTSTARLAIYCRAPRQQSRPSPSAGPSGSILSFREDLAAALCSSTVHELFVRHRNFVSTVRQSDSKQKAWGAIRMWSPLPRVPLSSLASICVVNRQSSCLSLKRSPIIILRTFFQNEWNAIIKPGNYCYVWAMITKSGRLMNCELTGTCTALEDRSISHLIVNLYFVQQRAKDKRGALWCQYIHILIHE